MHLGDPHHRRYLLLGRPEPARLAQLTGSIVPAGGALAVVAALDAADLDAAAGVVLDGDQAALDAASVLALRRFVEAGGSVLAIDAAAALPAPVDELLGVRARPRLPRGEFFGLVRQPDSRLTRRLPGEFSFVDAFTPLDHLNGGTRSLVDVSVGFRDHAAVVEYPLGAGRVVVSALGGGARGLEAPALQTLLRRSLGPALPGPEATLGVAIVGYGPLGGMGYRHGRAIQGTPGLRLVAACDTNQDRLNAAAVDFPGLRGYASAVELAADPSVDLVIIATPPANHADLAMAMLRAGKHVAVEKPLCLTVAEADALIEEARRAGLVLTVNQNRRWDADFLTLRRALEAGTIGDVFNLETFVGSFEHPCRAWHSEVSVSGGAEYDWGSHYIDWILQLMPGMPSTVSAVAHKRVWHDVTNFDQVRLRLLWDDGREAEFMHSDVAAIRRPKFYVQGTEGTLAGWYRPLVSERVDPGLGYVREEAHHAEAPAELVVMRYEPGQGGLIEQRLPPRPAEPFAFHRNLADHLLANDAPLAVTPESVRRVIAVLEAGGRSSANGGRAETPAIQD